ncbi:phospholipid-transporting ATPase ABCA1-like [Physella acuta]|uniref:phospholipid-transporting ATPase ABCA1-like n=1 Tax=Physella acuta TaxID=109671 RepID=UPI0027DC12DF|nr:phospholipid-transporting ATPase ABCA1-like [Physella acuta]
MFGKNVAVAGTNMDVYEGQITVLLGHNGAGKTTTINMITGFLPATSGTITVHGLDMRKNTDAARKSIGLCPQHDILFAKLTCKEHLIFSLKIHGLYNNESKAAIVDRLNALGLGGKMNSLASKLSGGQKRKLSLACAFSGDTKVIFLDEPSSGLDPAARREMWAFLKTMREGRTILLTTHYMDEADVLGDRIAIMAEGRVKCCGTPMFLKRVYGAGYTLKIVKQPSCLTDVVTEQILQIIPKAKYISETNSEIHYLLPENVTEMFPELLKVLENDAEQLKITGFGLTATTMEDVFVKVGEGGVAEDVAEANKKDDQSSVVIEMTESGPKERPKSSAVDLTKGSSTTPTEQIFKIFNESKCTTKPAVFYQQLRGIFIKKFILFKRSLVSSLILIILPLLFVAFGLYADRQEALLQIEPMTYSADRLTNLITPISTTKETSPRLVDAYKKQLPSSEFTELDRNDPDGYFLNWGNANGQEKYDQMGFGVLFNETGRTVLYYNGRLTHGQGLALQLMLNAEVKAALGDDFSIELGLQYFTAGSITGFAMSTLTAVIFAMVLLPVMFIYALIVERATGAKHLQTLSGVHPVAYWLGTFVFDFLLFITIITVYMCLLAFNHKVFLDRDRWLVLVIGFSAFSIASFPYLYLIQNIFSSPTIAIVIILIVNLVIGVIFSSIITVIKGIGVSLEGFYFFLDLFFGYISPNYALSSILLLMAFSGGANGFIEVMEGFSHELPKCYSKLLGQGVLSWIFIMLIEFKVIRLIWYRVSCIQTLFCGKKFADVQVAQEDDDIINEQKRVHESPKEDLLKSDALLLIDLKKVYCSLCCSIHTAVHPVSFGVPDKECLGLLGQNGAGKTTIFKMLTGDITLSAGEAYVGGYNIKSKIKKVQSMMSYCPQFDALHDSLTGRETLYLYARLRGVKEQYLNTITEMVIDFITLRPHEDKVTSAYSGGNKRKLSMGIAIIGDPHFIMLDEPTAGMDPISRRSLWKCLHMIRSMERTLVLTSHSMEECEALCTKIAILKRGRLMCLGSTQHLKNKFAQGYTVILHAKHQEDGAILPLKPAVDFLISSIPGTTVFNAQPSYYHLQVPETARLSEIFRLSLEARSTFDLQHFTVQQTSLEQVFLLHMKD